jgi:hypothetical protein
MGQSFLAAAMKVLLDMPLLVQPEREVMNALRVAADEERYDKQLLAFRMNPFTNIILINVITKGRASGLTPVLEKLRDDMENSQGDAEPHVPAAPVAEEAAACGAEGG